MVMVVRDGLRGHAWWKWRQVIFGNEKHAEILEILEGDGDEGVLNGGKGSKCMWLCCRDSEG